MRIHHLRPSWPIAPQPLCLGLWLLVGVATSACHAPEAPANRAQANAMSTPPVAPTASAATAPPRDEDPLARLRRLADVDTLDPDFAQWLTEHKHLPTMPAPQVLRSFLLSREVLRTSLHLGLSLTEGELRLHWFVDDCGMVGSADDLRTHIQNHLEEAAFAVQHHDAEHFPLRWVKNTPEMTIEWWAEEPAPWTGARQRTSGLSFIVALGTQTPATELTPLLEQVPFLIDPRIDAALWDTIATLPLEEISRGGTWERYLSTSMRFRAPDPASAWRAYVRSRDALIALGFTPPDNQAGDCHEAACAPVSLRLSRASSGSYAHIERPDADGRFRLHLQPES